MEKDRRKSETILPSQIFGYEFPWSTILLVAFYIAIIVIWALAARWIYNDANERGMDGPLWAVLIFVFGVLVTLLGIIVLIVYLVKRPS
ncbi:MAG: hypothetical protein QXR19_16345 [Candidatus Jordarchaeaceae archaeon]